MFAALLALALFAPVGMTGEATAPGDGAAGAVEMPPMPDAAPAPPALAPPGRGAGTLLLPGDGVTAALDCTGRNVMIEGNDVRYTLRGGCRSVTVQGHRNMVQAELQPGSRIAIGGDGDTVHYALTRPGPPPLISVTGAASRALALGGGPAP